MELAWPYENPNISLERKEGSRLPAKRQAEDPRQLGERRRGLEAAELGGQLVGGLVGGEPDRLGEDPEGSADDRLLHPREQEGVVEDPGAGLDVGSGMA